MSDVTSQPPIAGPPWLPDLLNATGGRWCLLRHAPDAPADNQDVDVLVAPEDHATVTAALHRYGYVALVTPGRGRHRFFLRYDADRDAWPKLDVVTGLAFGPHKEIVTSLGVGLLDRRRQFEGGLWTPTDDDAFWSLLLHALLDKGSVLEHHRGPLALLAPSARSDGPVATFVRDSVGSAAAPAALRGHAAAGRWGDLEALAPRLLQALRHRHPAGTWVRRQSRRVLRRADRAGVSRGDAALTVAVVGPDRSRQEVIGALQAIPLPMRRPPSLPGMRACAEALVVTDARRADVTLITTGAVNVAPHTAGAVVHLGEALTTDDLRRQVATAVWTAMTAKRRGKA